MPTDGMSRLISRGTSGRKEIALTFDAGSDRGYAKQILDVLKANGIKASFGITGVWAQNNPDLIQRMVSEGHMIINHTWSHPSFTGYSAQPALTSSTARTAELTKTADYIYTLTGYRTAPVLATSLRRYQHLCPDRCLQRGLLANGDVVGRFNGMEWRQHQSDPDPLRLQRQSGRYPPDACWR